VVRVLPPIGKPHRADDVRLGRHADAAPGLGPGEGPERTHVDELLAGAEAVPPDAVLVGEELGHRL
jgi:hypothetical protein